MWGDYLGGGWARKSIHRRDNLKRKPMGENTKIQPFDYQFSPWRLGVLRPLVRHKDWTQPVAWNRKASQFVGKCNRCGIISEMRSGATECPHDYKGCDGRLIQYHPRVYCASTADWLDEVPIRWLVDLLKLIHDTPYLDWLLLTKRVENWRRRMMAALESITDGTGKDGEFWQWLLEWIGGNPPANVWIGTTVENQKRADERIPLLLQIPAKVRFLSVEPMLERVNLKYVSLPNGGFLNALTGEHGVENGYYVEPNERRVNWVIYGFESGPNARPGNIEWIRSGVQRCKAAGIPVFVKQLGAFPVMDETAWRASGGTRLLNARLDRKAPEGCVAIKLNDPKGGDTNEWPEDLRIREFPEVVR